MIAGADACGSPGYFFVGSAVIRNPRIMILDEATSALDSRSEREVQAALDQLVETGHGRQTTLIVAHRLSTISNVDRVVVMRKGRIVESGSPRELRSRGTFVTRTPVAKVGGGNRCWLLVSAFVCHECADD